MTSEEQKAIDYSAKNLVREFEEILENSTWAEGGNDEYGASVIGRHEAAKQCATLCMERMIIETDYHIPDQQRINELKAINNTISKLK